MSRILAIFTVVFLLVGCTLETRPDSVDNFKQFTLDRFSQLYLRDNIFGITDAELIIDSVYDQQKIQLYKVDARNDNYALFHLAIKDVHPGLYQRSVSLLREKKPNDFESIQALMVDYEIKKARYNAEVKRQRVAEEKRARIEREQKYSSFEEKYFREYESIVNNIQPRNRFYMQPHNKKESCKLLMVGQEKEKGSNYRLYWDGQCKDGYAHGLGREIEQDDLVNRWVLAVFEKGEPKGYGIYHNILEDFLVEGEINYDGDAIEHQVHKKFFEINRSDAFVSYRAGTFGRTPINPAVFIEYSPLWNGAVISQKRYPNFMYQFRDFSKDSTQEVEFGFEIVDLDTGKRNGWGFEKNKGQDVVKGLYLNDVGTKTDDFPDAYLKKADDIVAEISLAAQEAHAAQEKAGIVKRQYLNRICRDSVTVDFMNSDEYKDICHSKREQELYAKIDAQIERQNKERMARLEAESRERMARLEQERINSQNRQNERFMQEKIAIERQRLENEKQRAASESFQRSMDSLNRQLREMRPKNTFTNCYGTYGGVNCNSTTY
jgi:hypothetical protein